MSLLLQVLFWVAMAGSITSTIYCLMVIAAAVRFGLRKRREDRVAATFLPALSVLKPLHGSEEGLERNIESFFEQDYPEFELLFCARHETDEGLQLAQRVGERYPHVDARYVTCGEPTPKFHNAKVYSLAKMDSVAKHPAVYYERCGCAGEEGLSVANGSELEGPADWAGFLRVSGDDGPGSARRAFRRSWMRWARAWR